MLQYIWNTDIATLCMIYGLISYNPFLTYIFNFFMYLIGIKCFKMKHNRPGITDKLLNFLSHNTIYSSEFICIDGKIYPSGYILGKGFIGIIHSVSSWDKEVTVDMTIYLKNFERIMEYSMKENNLMNINSESDNDSNTDTSSDNVSGSDTDTNSTDTCAFYTDKRSVSQCNIYVKGLYRSGDFGYFSYKSFNMNMYCKIHPLQQTIVDSIKKSYMTAKKGCLKVLLHGQSGSGKTSIAKFLALQLDSMYVESFNPIDPGDEFMCLYDDHSSKVRESPLIVVINEYDNIIKRIYANQVNVHKRFPIAWTDKTSHNNFLDKLDYLSNLIFIMTSNSPPEWFHSVDESLIRKKRIDKIIHVSIDPTTYGD